MSGLWSGVCGKDQGCDSFAFFFLLQSFKTATTLGLVGSKGGDADNLGSVQGLNAPAQSLQSCLLFVTPWTVAHQPPVSMGFSRQEYWSGLPQPPLEDFPNSGIEPMSFLSPALARGFFTTSTTWEAGSQVSPSLGKLLWFL